MSVPNPIVVEMSVQTNDVVVPMSVAENGTYTAPSGKAYSPVTVDVNNAAIISSFSVSENVRSIAIQCSDDWSNYDFVIIRFNALEVENRDWIYFSKTNSDVGAYVPYTQAKVSDISGTLSVVYAKNQEFFVSFPTLTKFESGLTLTQGEALYLYTYDANNYFKAGGEITVWGYNYANL